MVGPPAAFAYNNDLSLRLQPIHCQVCFVYISFRKSCPLRHIFCSINFALKVGFYFMFVFY